MNDEAVVGLLATEWGRLDDLYSGLAPQQWQLPTELPGWSVADLLAHVIGTESILDGRPPPAIELGDVTHVRNDIGRLNEVWIESMRATPPAALLTQFREITAARLDALRAMSSADFDAPTMTPRGPGTYRDFMDVRVFDCWFHENDARRVLGLDEHLDGPVVTHSLGECVRALGFVVGKKAGAPQGTTVVFDLTGSAGRRVAIGVEGRAGLLEQVPAEPTVTITTDVGTFCVLCGGRRPLAEVLAGGGVGITGDAALGNAILENLGFMI